MTKILEFQARSRDILRGDAIQRGDGPSQAGRLTLKAGGGGGGTRASDTAFRSKFERFEKHGFFFKLLNFKLKWFLFFKKTVVPVKPRLTVTSQPLSIGRLAKRLNFSSKNTSLIRSPVNTAKCFFCFLATENSIHFKLYSKTKGYTKKEQCVPSCLSSTRGSVIRPLWSAVKQPIGNLELPFLDTA